MRSARAHCDDAAYVPAIEKLRRLMAAGAWRDALKLAASWKNLGDEREAITRGWEAVARPAFYRAIGKDPAALYDEGVAALKRRYGDPEGW